MNETIQPIYNISQTILGNVNELPQICSIGSMKYSLECIYQEICPQFPSYFLKTGLTIIISYIILSWVTWWFFDYGYKKLDVSDGWKMKLIDISERRRIMLWIQQRVIIVMLMYIVITVWLSMGMTRFF